jgi:hypothetical protein
MPRAGWVDDEEKAAAVGVPTGRRGLDERRVQALLDVRTWLLASPGERRAIGAHGLNAHKLPHIAAAAQPSDRRDCGEKTLGIPDRGSRLSA